MRGDGFWQKNDEFSYCCASFMFLYCLADMGKCQRVKTFSRENVMKVSKGIPNYFHSNKNNWML